MTANAVTPAIDSNTGTQELVRQSQVAYDAGQDRRWAGLLWAAMEKAILELAKSRGIPDARTTVLLKQLDQLDVRPWDEYFSASLGSLIMLRTHYQLGVAESYWWDDLNTDAVAFIAFCHNAAAPENAAHWNPTLSPTKHWEDLPRVVKPDIEIDPQAEIMDLVERAQAAYDAGQDREWAGVLWRAGERAVRELAQSRGIPPDDSIIALLKQLDMQDTTVRDGYYCSHIGGLIMLRTHYQLGVVESYWWEDLHRDIIACITEFAAAAGN